MPQEFVRTLEKAAFSKRASLSERLHIDMPLLILILTLCLAGLIILYSASGGNIAMVERQAIRMGIGLIAMWLVAQFDPRFYAYWGFLAYGAGVAMLIAVLVIGTSGKGATRWLDLPGLPAFQPSEILKVAVPIMLAWYLTRYHLPPRAKHIAGSLVFLAIPFVLILKQPDLGTALLIAISGLFVIFLAGMSIKLIVGFASSVLLLAPVLWVFVMRDYQKQRVRTFLNPESDRFGSGWNIIQSKTAIGSGGLEGKGYMQGTQAQLDFLPESHTDFIIAVLAEEMGYIGVVLLIVLYLALTTRGVFIALNARESFGRLLAGSLVLTFFLSVFVNIGMVSGILPVVGVPLPLISYGGTSIVTLMGSFGLLMSISTHRKH